MDAFNLLDTTYITVGVRFFNEDECSHRESGKIYNYKAPRTAGIEVGDLLVVPATQTLRIVKVFEVHAEPQFNGLPNLKWIVQKIDRTEYDANLERERKFRDALQEVERVRKRDELIHTLTTSAAGSEAARTLLGEALTMIGAVPAPVADMAFRDPPAADATVSADDGSEAAKTLLGEALTMIGVGASEIPPPAPEWNYGTAGNTFGDGPAHADDGNAGFTPPKAGDSF